MQTLQWNKLFRKEIENINEKEIIPAFETVKSPNGILHLSPKGNSQEEEEEAVGRTQRQKGSVRGARQHTWKLKTRREKLQEILSF